MLGSHSDFVFFCQFPVVELLTVTHGSFGLRMNLLMTEQVNQRQVAIAVCAPLRAGQQMVDLQFFLIEEGVPTFWTPTVLSLGQLLFGKGQVFGFRCLPFRPVVFERGVIW